MFEVSLFDTQLKRKRVLRTRIDANTAIDARIFVNLADVVDRKRVLRTLAYANIAADTFVGIDANSHYFPNLS